MPSTSRARTYQIETRMSTCERAVFRHFGPQQRRFLIRCHISCAIMATSRQPAGGRNLARGDRPNGLQVSIRGGFDMNAKKYAAEAIGTFWLTFAGCGSAVIAAGFPQVGIGLLGVSFAFGLSVVTMAYAIGH